MLKAMTMRDLKTAYIGSAFGFSWAVLNPLAQVALYGIVFGVFFKSMPDPVYRTDSFFLFLICGILPWQFFAQAVNASVPVITANRNLVKKAVGFPSELLPIVTVAGNIVSHLIAMALLIIFLVFTGNLTPYALLTFVYLFFAVIFAVGLGWMLSSVQVFLRDVQQLMSVVMMVWLFLTPIFYSASIVPPRYLFVLKLNPMYEVVEGYRLALLGGTMLPPADFAYLAITSVATLAVGGVFFRKLKPWFAEVL